MNSLSAILADMEACAVKIKSLETDLAAERGNGKTLIERYNAQSADALKALGIGSKFHKDRKPRSQQSVLIRAAARSIRLSVQGGEKNAKTMLASAVEAAEKTAINKLNLAELPVEIKQQIEDRVRALGKK